ncbi:Ubiquinone biosynthesis monooxygenase COQ6, mitochondrial [Sphaceloma murrayae]|uniref:Ubiquinone biosynthesis monooxygenase COQ6, mitochondrial n=1 Tax=Sphaceloma murrayae TaxID=2082308 RepID=A0A2K1QYM8_9PEZI|nr:Ubiquinone biosynthesis monooxygenase COQ6, mitochondrial [Sphaceloma murrayae]
MTIEVAIVGAGVAGLTAAISLRKYVGSDVNMNIRIYERLDIGDTEQPRGRAEDHVAVAPRVGAALGLQGNGLQVLGQLDPRIRAAVEHGGFACRGFRFLTAGQWLLGSIAQPTTMISRGILIKALRDALPSNLVHQRHVEQITVLSGQSPSLLLKGEEVPHRVDLLIGADGIRSPTRHAIFGDDPSYHTEYSGSCAVGGFHSMPVPTDLINQHSATFVYGSTGFFGYSALSAYTRDRLMYWSVYQSPLPERDERLDLNQVDEMLRQRHGSWEDTVIQDIISKIKVENVWPIMFVPPLPSWGRDGAVLVGDAAHAMTPRSGQGASQGIEDAQTLAMLLAEQLRLCPSKEEAIQKTIDDLYLLRKERVGRIHEQANTVKEPKLPMSRAQTWILYALLFVMTKLSSFVDIFPRPGAWDAEAVVKSYLTRCT